jgi:hypothetical protein
MTRRTRLVLVLVCVLAIVGTGLAIRASRAGDGATPPVESPTSAPASPTKAPASSAKPAPSGSPSAARRILGPSRSGLPWHSGAWVGGRFSRSVIDGFGTWRGRPTDVVTTYSPDASYESLMNDPYSITVWKGFEGRLNYGLSILPDDGDGSLASIGAGEQDAVWRKVAQNLVKNDRGDSIVRVAWESNLKDWRWQVTADNTDEYKAAFRRVVTVMRAEAPDLVFEFGVACGSGLSGSDDRLAPLTAVYPGNDVVDLIGCDTYDWQNTSAKSDAEWPNVLRPAAGTGLEDVTEFARKHGKGAAFGEWGLAKPSNGNGGGDNPYYIEAMFNFFKGNQDVVVFECYFDEPDDYISNSIYGTEQNPNASAAYARLW